MKSLGMFGYIFLNIKKKGLKVADQMSSFLSANFLVSHIWMRGEQLTMADFHKTYTKVVGIVKY